MTEVREMVKRANKRLTETQLCFEAHMAELGLDCVREYQFHSPRKWRADYMVKRPMAISFPHNMTLVEFEGGVWTQGRHTRGSGFIKDLIKYNFASAIGYHVFRFTPQQVKSGEAKEFIKRCL